MEHMWNFWDVRLSVCQWLAIGNGTMTSTNFFMVQNYKKGGIQWLEQVEGVLKVTYFAGIGA